jgi:hypothetical protein
MKINVTHNFPQVQKALATMRADIGKRAMASALNKTVEQARTQMAREIVSEYRVTSGYVRERLRVRRAFFKAGQIGLNAELIGGGKRRSANLIAFVEKAVTMAEAKRRGKAGTLNQLRFQVRRSGGKKTVKGAFIGNQGRTVFARATDKRLPIKAIQTIDVGQMFNQKRINDRVVAAIKQRFPVIFERDARFFIDKFNKR